MCKINWLYFNGHPIQVKFGDLGSWIVERGRTLFRRSPISRLLSILYKRPRVLRNSATFIKSEDLLGGSSSGTLVNATLVLYARTKFKKNELLPLFVILEIENIYLKYLMTIGYLNKAYQDEILSETCVTYNIAISEDRAVIMLGLQDTYLA